MPSGAKKRKAAKRKQQEQEQEQEQQQQLGVHLTSPSTGHSHPAEGGSVQPSGEAPHEGNGEREEQDGLTSQEGKGSESGSEFASPTAHDNHHHHHHLEFEGDKVQSEASIKARGDEKNDKRGGNTTGAVDSVNVMESSENGGGEQPSESLAPRKTDEVPKKSEEEVPVAAVEVKKDDIPSLPSSDPIPPTSPGVPTSEAEALNVEHIQYEKRADVVVPGEIPPSIEHKQPDAIETPIPIQLSVPISEELVQASDVPVESLEVVESIAEAPSNKNEEKVVPLSDPGSEQADPSVESHPHTDDREIAGTAGTQVAQSTQLEQRTSWMSCCGLFDFVTGANR